MDKSKEVKKKLVKEFELGKVYTFLEGKAPEQHNPKPVSIEGTITAVSRFIEKRKEEFDEKKAHCLVSKSDGTIELIVNEQSVCDKYTVKGSLDIGRRFKELGINTETSYEPIKLAKKFRLLRSIFTSHAEHSSIVKVLSNVKATSNQKYDESNKDNGSMSLSYEQVVESNIPESFKLNLPLLEGEEPSEIEVFVLLKVNRANDILCFLESVDGADMIEEMKIKRTNEEVEKIEENCTVIFH